MYRTIVFLSVSLISLSMVSCVKEVFHPITDFAKKLWIQDTETILYFITDSTAQYDTLRYLSLEKQVVQGGGRPRNMYETIKIGLKFAKNYDEGLLQIRGEEADIFCFFKFPTSYDMLVGYIDREYEENKKNNPNYVDTSREYFETLSLRGQSFKDVFVFEALGINSNNTVGFFMNKFWFSVEHGLIAYRTVDNEVWYRTNF